MNIWWRPSHVSKVLCEMCFASAVQFLTWVPQDTLIVSVTGSETKSNNNQRRNQGVTQLPTMLGWKRKFWIIRNTFYMLVLCSAPTISGRQVNYRKLIDYQICLLSPHYHSPTPGTHHHHSHNSQAAAKIKAQDWTKTTWEFKTLKLFLTNFKYRKKIFLD